MKNKFWKIYEVFRIIWNLFWKFLSFISVLVCSKEFNLALNAVWIIVLFWLFGCMKCYEFYRVDFSMYLLSEVILLNLNTICVMSYSIISMSLKSLILFLEWLNEQVCERWSSRWLSTIVWVYECCPGVKREQNDPLEGYI